MTNSAKNKTLRPRGARVIVRRKNEEKSAGGIYLPEQSKQANCEGIIEAIGPDCLENTHEGQRIVFGYYAGSTIKGWSDQDIIILNEEDILCDIVEGE